jgi:hypothetical protein
MHHAPRRFRIAESISEAIQKFPSHFLFEVTMSFGQGAELLVGRSVILLAIAAATPPAFIQLHVGKAARAMIIQVGVEMSRIEALDAVGVFTGDMSVASRCLRMMAPFLPSTSALSELRLGRERVKSTSSLWSSLATVWLTNSEPLSA